MGIHERKEQSIWAALLKCNEDAGFGEEIVDKREFHLSRAQRMQLKAFVCLLGILLIVILIIGKLSSALCHGDKDNEVQPEPHIPTVRVLKNVWIAEAGEAGLTVFNEGERASFQWGVPDGDGQENAESYDSGDRQPWAGYREQVADVTLTDNLVTEVAVKAEKINGRVLSYTGNCIELEGYGRLPLSEEYHGYRLYGSLAMCTVQDLSCGYDNADFCLENGEICAVLLAREEAMQYIRVLIRASDYTGLLHASPVITADTDFTVVYSTGGEEKREEHSAGEELCFSYDSPYFEGGRVCVVPDTLTGKLLLPNVNRSQGVPAYRGKMELLRTEDGIAVINELPLEEYLYSVVPSEMPASYPAEALRAQAICARTYAYGHMLHAAYPQYGAHVDDSTAFQVYNNITEQESATAAVKDTYGQLLCTGDGELAETFYYSTSCGVGSDANVWKTQAAPGLTYLKAREISTEAMENLLCQTGAAQTTGTVEAGEDLAGRLRDEAAFRNFILSKDVKHFEAKEGWYRWSYEVEQIDSRRILGALQRRYAANSSLVLTLVDGEYVSREIDRIGAITDIYVAKRGAGGVTDELVIASDEGSYKVVSEYNIRAVLCDGQSKAVRQDGSEVSCPNLLPSGFFIISTGKEKESVVGYSIIGGGFGHGVGMSQNGARQMANAGWAAGEILRFFYADCNLEFIYEESGK